MIPSFDSPSTSAFTWVFLSRFMSCDIYIKQRSNPLRFEENSLFIDLPGLISKHSLYCFSSDKQHYMFLLTIFLSVFLESPKRLNVCVCGSMHAIMFVPVLSSALSKIPHLRKLISFMISKDNVWGVGTGNERMDVFFCLHA